MRRFRAYILDETGQSTTEFILLVSLISVPIYFGARGFMDIFLRRFITAIVESLTKG